MEPTEYMHITGEFISLAYAVWAGYSNNGCTAERLRTQYLLSPPGCISVILIGAEGIEDS